MDVADTAILTVNGGSSSIKFALFYVGRWLTRVLSGAIENIGQADATLRTRTTPSEASSTRKIAAPDRKAAVRVLMTWVARNRVGEGAISAASSRVCVRVLRTDEERMIAEAVCGALSMSHAGFRDALRTGGSA